MCRDWGSVPIAGFCTDCILCLDVSFLSPTKLYPLFSLGNVRATSLDHHTKNCNCPQNFTPLYVGVCVCVCVCVLLPFCQKTQDTRIWVVGSSLKAGLEVEKNECKSKWIFQSKTIVLFTPSSVEINIQLRSNTKIKDSDGCLGLNSKAPVSSKPHQQSDGTLKMR